MLPTRGCSYRIKYCTFFSFTQAYLSPTVFSVIPCHGPPLNQSCQVFWVMVMFRFYTTASTRRLALSLKLLQIPGLFLVMLAGYTTLESKKDLWKTVWEMILQNIYFYLQFSWSNKFSLSDKKYVAKLFLFQKEFLQKKKRRIFPFFSRNKKAFTGVKLKKSQRTKD